MGLRLIALLVAVLWFGLGVGIAKRVKWAAGAGIGLAVVTVVLPCLAIQMVAGAKQPYHGLDAILGFLFIAMSSKKANERWCSR